MRILGTSWGLKYGLLFLWGHAGSSALLHVSLFFTCDLVQHHPHCWAVALLDLSGKLGSPCVLFWAPMSYSTSIPQVFISTFLSLIQSLHLLLAQMRWLFSSSVLALLFQKALRASVWDIYLSAPRARAFGPSRSLDLKHAACWIAKNVQKVQWSAPWCLTALAHLPVPFGTASVGASAPEFWY